MLWLEDGKILYGYWHICSSSSSKQKEKKKNRLFLTLECNEMFPEWKKQLTTLEYPGVCISRETLVSKACILLKHVFVPKTKMREKSKKSIEDCCPTDFFLFFPERPQVPSPLFQWLESHGCHHSHLVFQLTLFAYLPKLGG